MDFIRKVADKSTGLYSDISKIALGKNEIDQLFEIFIENNATNKDLFIIMLGAEFYTDFLEIINREKQDA